VLLKHRTEWGFRTQWGTPHTSLGANGRNHSVWMDCWGCKKLKIVT